MSGVFLFLFACFWSASVLCFDGTVARDLARQYESGRYPVVMGKVTFSDVVYHHSSKGSSYGVDIRYHYVVDDHPYDGKRLRYNVITSFSLAGATDMVNEHPVGSPIRVYFNASNPADAILSPEIEGGDLMIVLFLMPFNLIMFGFWAGIGGWLRRTVFQREAGGVKIIVDGPRTSIRLPQYGALVGCMIAMGVLSFISIFIVGFATAFHPSMTIALLTLFLVIAAGAVTYARQWQKIHSGDDDLIFDEASRTIALPETYGRKERVTVSVAEIENLSVEVVVNHNSKGGDSYTFAPTLWLRQNQKSEPQKLANWSDRKRAEAFAEWLRQRLNLPGVPVERS